MSDIYDSKHEWRSGNSVQWGAQGLRYDAAATPFHCERCGAKFVHYYHRQPDIYKAIAEVGIENGHCP